MKKSETKAANIRENPFLTNKADALWERLEKHGKPVTKDELVRRAKSSREKTNS